MKSRRSTRSISCRRSGPASTGASGGFALHWCPAYCAPPPGRHHPSSRAVSPGPRMQLRPSRVTINLDCCTDRLLRPGTGHAPGRTARLRRKRNNLRRFQVRRCRAFRRRLQPAVHHQMLPAWRGDLPARYAAGHIVRCSIDEVRASLICIHASPRGAGRGH